jgi:putative transposase
MAWFATLVFEHQPVPLPANDLAVGIDVGVTAFAKFSDGTEIQNPRIYQNTQAELRRAQRRVARRKKGSHRRGRAILLLKKVHQSISNRRRDFLHQHSTAVIRKYGTVKVEGLNVSGMSRGNLAKQILDCSWSEWFRQLRYKAEEAGRRLVAVDPKYTSQICSQCGFKHPDNRKTQADFACLSCGYQDNADHNAAVNISARNEPLDANVSGVTLCVV